MKDSSHKQVRPIRHNVTASSSGGTAALCVAVMPPSKLTVVIAAIQGHDNAQHKAKTWKLRDIRMCRNLFLKRTSRSKQHSSSNEAFSLNNSSESESWENSDFTFWNYPKWLEKVKQGIFRGSFAAQRRLKKRTIVWLFCMLCCFS